MTVRANSRYLILGCLAAMAVSCGGGGGSGGTSTVQPVGNAAPAIAGRPASSVNEGLMYEFTPTASDSDGDTLTFSVDNLPSWANFDESTGSISGTADYASAGVYADIVISVSDGEESQSLPAFSVTVVDAVGLTLSGQIYGLELPQALVTLEVADEIFTATADSDGNFQLEANLRADIDGDIALLRATGVGDRDHIELVSQLYYVLNYVADSQQHTSLDKQQEPRLYISDLSSARYILANSATSKDNPSTSAQWQVAELAANESQLVKLASAIQWLADYADDEIELGGTTLTSFWGDNPLEVLNDWFDTHELTTEFYDVQSYNWSLLNSDSPLTSTLNEAMITGTKVLHLPAQPGFMPSEIEQVLVFHDDGTGVSYWHNEVESTSADAAFAWSLSNGELQLTYATGQSYALSAFFVGAQSLASYGFGDDVVQWADGIQQASDPVEAIELRLTVESQTLTLLMDYDDLQQWHVANSLRYEFPQDWNNGDLNNFTESALNPTATGSSSTMVMQGVPQDSSPSVDFDTQVGSYLSLPRFGTASQSYSNQAGQDLLLLQADSVAQSQVDGTLFSWQQIDNGVELSVANYRYQVVPYQQSGELYSALVWVFSNNQLMQVFGAGTTLTAELPTVEASALTAAEFPQLWATSYKWQAPTGFNPDDASGDYGRWIPADTVYQLSSSGVAQQYNLLGLLMENCESVISDPYCVAEAWQDSWQIDNASGELVIEGSLTQRSLPVAIDARGQPVLISELYFNVGGSTPLQPASLQILYQTDVSKL
ncbi:putative Ig domain-containing protein [Neiella marina]|uniref:Ig domain-containing protein n=1 Tax=Neiella holothuriorum TaxID=2870530 RepID=A0ABS7EFL1_9GAMM|nr:putative Ig domain-containing protein [Neiella holothuriorum]MBW8191040.1 putative Ig domain-containing protein [Neiella holothuriorum]